MQSTEKVFLMDCKKKLTTDGNTSTSDNLISESGKQSVQYSQTQTKTKYSLKRSLIDSSQIACLLHQ